MSHNNAPQFYPSKNGDYSESKASFVKGIILEKVLSIFASTLFRLSIFPAMENIVLFSSVQFRSIIESEEFSSLTQKTENYHQAGFLLKTKLSKSGPFLIQLIRSFKTFMRCYKDRSCFNKLSTHKEINCLYRLDNSVNFIWSKFADDINFFKKRLSRNW